MKFNQNLSSGQIAILHVEHLKRERKLLSGSKHMGNKIFCLFVIGDGRGGFVHYILHLDISIYFQNQLISPFN